MLTRLLIAPIRWYQRYLSPLKQGPSCRYLPTCSSYAIEAAQKRGPLVGIAFALWRVLRCNPLFHAGYDPVPPCRHDVRARVGEVGSPAKRHW
jgi:putative membrane protein insertion efficiency factor